MCGPVFGYSIERFEGEGKSWGNWRCLRWGPNRGEAVMTGLVSKRLVDGLRPAQTAAIWLVWVRGHYVENRPRGACHSEPVVEANIRRGLKRLVAMAQGKSNAN